MAKILYPSSIGLFGIFTLWFERPANCTIISSIEQLVDGRYADLKEFASIVAIGSSFIYHAGGDAGDGSDIWIYFWICRNRLNPIKSIGICRVTPVQ